MEESNLTKIVKTKKGTKKKSSDHNPILTNFKIKWCSKVSNRRIEMFNLKNKECPAKIMQMRSNSTILTYTFNSSDDLNTCTR